MLYNTCLLVAILVSWVRAHDGHDLGNHRLGAAWGAQSILAPGLAENRASCCYKSTQQVFENVTPDSSQPSVKSVLEWKGKFDHDKVNKTLLPYVFEPLPLGSIKPRGWFRQQLELMAHGLPGHLHEFYRIVRDATWLGGSEEYSPLNEAWPYYINGIIPLAYGLDDDRLQHELRRQVASVLEHQQEDGWLGPETEVKRRNFWGRYPFFLALAQLAEAAEPHETKEIVKAMHKFVKLMHKMLSDDYQGYVWHEGDDFDQQWGRSRAADMVLALQWLYERYPDGNEKIIHDCMLYMYEQSYDWSYWFTDDVFFKADLDTLPLQWTEAMFPYVHGVNAGQGLKAGAVMRRLVHDDSLLNSTRRGVNWTFEYHGTPSGAIIGDEREAGLSPVRGTELCSVVETMFSLSYLYQALGDNSFADRVELAAFNALPVMVMPRWWAHQYIAQTNQPVSHRLANPPFWNVGPYGQTFGTEPNYPCCTVDFSQGYPKLLSAAYVRNGADGLGHAILIPSELRTTIPETRNEVHISCETNYPFSDFLTYNIHNTRPFPFSIRIPSWANASLSTLWLNNSTHPEPPPHPSAHSGMHTITLPAGHTTLELLLSTTLHIHTRPNGTVSLTHGALVFALPVPAHYSSTAPSRYPGRSAPAAARDWTITPSPNHTSSAWNVGIDPSTARFFAAPDREAELPDPVWDDGAPPVAVSVLACELEGWGWEGADSQGTGGYAAPPPPQDRRRCKGRSYMVELKPLGSARLHMVEFPVMKLR